jgi:phosphatidate phosphatase APP1
MEWLPSVLVLAMGIVLLVVLVVSLLGPLRRARAASRTMTVAVTGRMMRVRAGVAELNAWRAARHSGDTGA